MADALVDTRVLGKGVTYFYGKDADFAYREHGLMAYLQSRTKRFLTSP